MAVNDLKEIMARKVEIRSALQGEEEVDLAALKTELESLNAKEEEIRSREEMANKINVGTIETKVIEKPEVRSKMDNKDWASSVEYRNAFMTFVQTGEMPEEFRAVAMTAGNSAVMPVPTLNQIIQKLENYGNILPLVTRVSYPTGMNIPTSQLGGMAVWTTETDMSTKGIAIDGKTTGSITFSAFPLVKAVGLSFIAHVQTLSAFESALVNEVPVAMGRALEMAIIKGTGNGQCTGILSATPAKTVELSTKLSFKDIVNLKKSIPAMYRNGAVLVVNESTFYEFYGMTDSNGQPIARVNDNIAGQPTFQLFGTPVVVTDWLPDYDAAADGETLGFIMQMDKYILNCAYSMDIVTYQEQATRNKVYQAFAMYDGKVADANGLVFVKKASTAAKA